MSKKKIQERAQFPFWTSILVSILTVSYFSFTIAQIWLEDKLVAWDTFFKISLTYAVICGATFLIFVVFHDLYQEGQNKKDKDII
ncbi:MAG: hypothetical protein JXR30_02930 [Alphaproteobacteria bacterium]|nr:hypothetical protein [Alphaproteobacteria bacterium]